MTNHRQKGTFVERIVAAYLEDRGVEILERNYRNRYGEVDLIGKHEGYLVFVEVKYRATLAKGSPQEAVGLQKQRRICAVADYYRCVHGIPLSTPIRYDVAAVLGEQVTWYRNAFPHRERYG